MWPLIDIYFLNNAFLVLFVGSLVNFFEAFLPAFIVDNFRYGKFSQINKSSTMKFDIPKSYFKHFYMVAVILFTIAFLSVLNVYYFTFYVPPWIANFLDFWCGSDRTVTATPGGTLIALGLLTIQCYRRFYETFFVQVFAKSSKINLFIYLVGHLHYIGCLIALLGHSPGFLNKQENIGESTIFDPWTIVVAIPCVILFSIAWLNQFRSNLILANLRKDKKSNKVITEKHFIPKGGWFDHISCPHQLCEIVIYISLFPLLGKNSSWICVFLWVLSNQIETALLSHWWYKETFSNYPKNRKALIPTIL